MLSFGKKKKGIKSYLEKEGTAKRCFSYFANKLPKHKEQNPTNTNNSLHLYHHKLSGDRNTDQPQLPFNSLSKVQL